MICVLYDEDIKRSSVVSFSRNFMNIYNVLLLAKLLLSSGLTQEERERGGAIPTTACAVSPYQMSNKVCVGFETHWAWSRYK